MIIMRTLIIYSLLICLFYSCKEKTRYQLTILIKNETGNSLTLTLFPKEKYMLGDLYNFSDISSGHHYTTFEITPGFEEMLYISSDLKIQPNILTAQVFDSIQISQVNGNDLALKFSQDTAIGYTENLYKATSAWIYEIRDFDLRTQFRRNPVESHDYIFVISQDHYLKK